MFVGLCAAALTQLAETSHRRLNLLAGEGF